jgi:hypothetical protein
MFYFVSANSPPKFTSPNAVIRLHYKMATNGLLDINATDPDGDPVTFSIQGPDWMTIDRVTGVISVKAVPLMSAATTPVRVYATDNKNLSSVLIPTVTFCPCLQSVSIKFTSNFFYRSSGHGRPTTNCYG